MKPLNSIHLCLCERKLSNPQIKHPYLICSPHLSLAMMSPDNILAKQVTKDDGQGAGNRKTESSRTAEQSLKCPRCDSPNTKFCYYNNYSLTQPRHFCKTCRRYWTKGGALRKVPLGGGCRKNKKVQSSLRFSGDSKDSLSSSEISGTLNFLHGLSPAMDFQLGGFSFPRLHPPTTGIYNQFSSFGDVSGTYAAASGSVTSPYFTLDPSGSYNSLMRFNYPLSSTSGGGPRGPFSAAVQNTSSMNIHSGLASSIESQNTINQDLHWKLQQRRLATLFGGEIQKDNSVSSVPLESHTQKSQPIVFQNLEISKSEDCSAGNSIKECTSTGHQIATEWYFGNSYGPVTATPTNSTAGNAGQGNANSWNGAQAWGDLQQYSALP